MSIGRRCNLRPGEEGAAAVEMALLLPFLLVLVFGVIQLGFGHSQSMAVDNSAREGARAAAQGRDCAEVVARATAALQAMTLEISEDPPPVDNTFPSPSVGTNLNTQVDGLPDSGNVCPSLSAVPCEGAAVSAIAVTVSFDRQFVIPLLIDEPDFRIARRVVFECE